MNKYTVKLESQKDVVDFVNMMGRSDCDADLVCGSLTVDACSLLGVLSIGLNKNIELLTYGEPGEEFSTKIASYCIA